MGCGISEVGLVGFQGGVTMFSGWGWRPDEQLEANKGPAPKPPDYKREPFATHSVIN